MTTVCVRLPPDDQDAVDRLVERFAPLLHLHPDERWLPDDVDTFLEHVRVQIGKDEIVPLVNGSLPVGPDTEDYFIIADLPRGGCPACGGCRTYPSSSRG